MNTSAETARNGLAETIDGARDAGTRVALRLVTFRVGEEEFGIDILSVREIHRLVEPTRVPMVPAGVEGVINLRGTIVPVVDLRKRCGMPAGEPTAAGRIVIVDIPGRTIGIVADRVLEVTDIESPCVEAANEMVGSASAGSVAGIVRLPDRQLKMLDIERLFEHVERDGTGEQRRGDA